MNKRLLLIFLLGVSNFVIGQQVISIESISNDTTGPSKIRRKISDRDYFVKMRADTINGIYIPKDLRECFVQLDRLLTPEEKVAMKNLKSKDDMKHYHLGLGTWIRNNWGLWPGSRLQKYFMTRGFAGPEEMSSIILTFYYDWLNCKNDKWKEWVAAKSPRKS